MAAGSLCGIIITPLLIGPAADQASAPTLSHAAAAAALNCSLNASDVDCFIVGFNDSTSYTATRSTTLLSTSSVDQLVNKV